MENKTGVYKIVNKINGKVYYGSATISFAKRWKNHRNKLAINTHENSRLQNAWNKYGASNFDFVIILLCDPYNCLYYEQLFLDKYWDNCKKCYNIEPKAENSLGRKHTKETRRKMSIAQSGTNNGFYKTHTLESRKKISEHRSGIPNTNKGKKHTPEQIIKNSESHKGQIAWNKGKQDLGPLSAETKDKLSLMLSGENNPNVKLNWVKIEEIRHKYKNCNYTIKQLASEYFISKSAIDKIIYNKTWITKQ